jgi:L,D-peptidoglycan transpeptidase YkuD (ErfK/YbiS/YcfS/YnhG family)
VAVRKKAALLVTASALALAVALAGAGDLLRRGAPTEAVAAGESGAARAAEVSSPAAIVAATASPTATSSPSPLSSAKATKPSPSPSRSSASRTPSTAGAPSADNPASRLRHLPTNTQQVIIVSAANYTTSYAAVETFVKRNGVWQPALGRMAARIGTKGFADRKVEGDLKTPTGMHSIGTTMYGVASNPGLRFGFHGLVSGDYWNENPSSPGYNTFTHGANPGGASEPLWQITPQYNYFAVISYNMPVVAANPPRGSGIFLHVMVSGRSTAGCVALAEADLLRVLKWLDPAAAPRIVMAPTSVLNRY